MKNLANYISASRIIMSILLLIPATFSLEFNLIYLYCGLSDMLDGFIARKTHHESQLGARLDSLADFIFVLVTMIKILPVLHLSNGILVWAAFIAFIKIVNAICSCIYYHQIVLPHTTTNKITGFLLFIAPFIIVNPHSIIIEIIICMIATFAAVQEGHHLRSKKHHLS